MAAAVASGPARCREGVCRVRLDQMNRLRPLPDDNLSFSEGRRTGRLQAMPEPRPDVDPRRVRLGLIVLTIVFFVALVVVMVVDDALGRTLMTGILVVTLIRAALLVRSLRRDTRG